MKLRQHEQRKHMSFVLLPKWCTKIIKFKVSNKLAITKRKSRLGFKLYTIGNLIQIQAVQLTLWIKEYTCTGKYSNNHVCVKVYLYGHIRLQGLSFQVFSLVEQGSLRITWLPISTNSLNLNGLLHNKYILQIRTIFIKATT